MRELSRFLEWQAKQPAIRVSDADQRLFDISGRLYPYIHDLYEPIHKDARIDPGIKDHLRRSLHNWLEWMTVLVNFTKPAVLRPAAEGEKEANAILFQSLIHSTFDGLFQSLINDHIIEDTGIKFRRRTCLYLR